MDVSDKLEILTEAARYDVACTSSGVDRGAKKGALGSAVAAGCCHSFAADGRCITLLKVLMTNVCTYDCAYCANRRSNDIPRAAFTPRELADLTIEFYRRNYIEGLFVSSGVIRDADFTMELLIKTCALLRNEHGFRGYIHAKAIPGASPELIDELGHLCDRLSANIELPSQRGMLLLAPEKSHLSLTQPIAQIAQGIQANRDELAHTRALTRRERKMSDSFAPAGQSTQLIVGATPDSDRQILRLSRKLYQKYDLKRVFFSAYLPVNAHDLLPDASVTVPLDREHRLYQADWLMRFYQFDADELVSEEQPNLDTLFDPKTAWALAHLDSFPIEVNRAPYEMLLRIPGLGVTGAHKLMQARRHMSLRPETFKRLGLSLKRIQFFVTFSGVYIAPVTFDQALIRARLAAMDARGGKVARAGGKRVMEGQLSFFDTPEASSDERGYARAFEAQRRQLALLAPTTEKEACSAREGSVPASQLSSASSWPRLKVAV
jgi:putative DNA modification/repair radical SAM protein